MAHRLQPALVLCTASVFLSALWGSAVAQGLPSATLFGTGNQICNYQYAIPKNTNCVTYGPSLEQKLDAVQRDVDRAKMQYISQNTIILELRRQNADKDVKISDLTKDLKSLEATVNSLQSAVAINSANIGKPATTTTTNNNNPNNAALQQLVTTTRNQLSQDIYSLENKLNTAVASIQQDRQHDAVQQSTVNTAFQAQLQQQQQNMTTFLKTQQKLQIDVINLQLALQKLPTATASPAVITTTTTKKPPVTTPPTTTTSTTTTTPKPVVTTPAGPTTPNPLLTQLLKRVQQLERDYQTDIPSLKQNMTYLNELSKNQTLLVTDAKAEADYLQFTEIPDLKNQQKVAHDEIAQLFKTVAQDLRPLQSQVQKIAANVSSVSKQLSTLAIDTITEKVKLQRDEQKITDLSTLIQMLTGRLVTVESSLNVTTTPPPSTTPTTFKVPTLAPNAGKTTTSGFKIPTLFPSASKTTAGFKIPTPANG